MTRSRFLAVLLLATAATACDRGRTPTAPLVQADEAEIETLLAGASADAASMDGRGISLFDRLAQEIQSFGGLYRNGHCAVAVVLTDMSEAEKAIRVVKAALEPLRACPDGLRVHAVQGDFTYVQLIRFFAAARPLHRIDGVRGVKIDYQLNRLVVYVATRQVAQKVIEVLPQLDIPLQAVTFQLSGSTRRG